MKAKPEAGNHRFRLSFTILSITVSLLILSTASYAQSINFGGLSQREVSEGKLYVSGRATSENPNKWTRKNQSLAAARAIAAKNACERLIGLSIRNTNDVEDQKFKGSMTKLASECANRADLAGFSCYDDPDIDPIPPRWEPLSGSDAFSNAKITCTLPLVRLNDAVTYIRNLYKRDNYLIRSGLTDKHAKRIESLEGKMGRVGVKVDKLDSILQTASGGEQTVQNNVRKLQQRLKSLAQEKKDAVDELKRVKNRMNRYEYKTDKLDQKLAMTVDKLEVQVSQYASELNRLNKRINNVGSELKIEERYSGVIIKVCKGSIIPSDNVIVLAEQKDSDKLDMVYSAASNYLQDGAGPHRGNVAVVDSMEAALKNERIRMETAYGDIVKPLEIRAKSVAGDTIIVSEDSGHTFMNLNRRQSIIENGRVVVVTNSCN